MPPTGRRYRYVTGAASEVSRIVTDVQPAGWVRSRRFRAGVLWRPRDRGRGNGTLILAFDRFISTTAGGKVWLYAAQIMSAGISTDTKIIN